MELIRLCVFISKISYPNFGANKHIIMIISYSSNLTYLPVRINLFIFLNITPVR